MTYTEAVEKERSRALFNNTESEAEHAERKAKKRKHPVETLTNEFNDFNHMLPTKSKENGLYIIIYQFSYLFLQLKVHPHPLKWLTIRR